MDARYCGAGDVGHSWSEAHAAHRATQARQLAEARAGRRVVRQCHSRRLPCLAAIAVLVPACAVRAEVLEVGPTGFVIENSVTVPTDPAAAWRALVDDVGRWWPADHTWFGESDNLSIEARAGGCFCEIDGARQAQHMIIAMVVPERLLRMLGGLGPLQQMGLHGALDWQLETVEAGTRITLRYQATGFAPRDLEALAPVVDRVQAEQLGGLAEYLNP